MGAMPLTETTAVAARYLGLVDEVRHWQLVQQARIKNLLPKRRLERDGFGSPSWLEAIIALLEGVEDERKADILREWRVHPLRAWGLEQRGVGEHSLAIVVGLLDGDPYIAYPRRWFGERKSGRLLTGEPFARSVSQLWSYCGYGDASRRRQEGMSRDDLLALGKPLLKARIHVLVAAASRMMCDAHKLRSAEFKAENPGKTPSWEPPPPGCTCREDGLLLRAIYDDSRVSVMGREDWTANRQHFHAYRIAKKYGFLLPLWLEAKRLHESGEWGAA